jgi:hypothetical protein
MSKIVSAANAMISNDHKIGSVSPNGSEYFFLYDNKHKWSIRHDAGTTENTVLFFYPSDDISIEQLASFGQDDWQYYNKMVSYSAKEIGTIEAEQTFKELFSIVKEKAFGVDDVLDQIISDLPF